MLRPILPLAALLAVMTSRAQAEEKTGPSLDVEVRGKPRSRVEGAKDPSVPGSTLPRDALESPGLRAPDALRTMVGVTVTETGGLGAASTAQIRGATAAQTPVYLAGVRINDDVAGVADLSSVPLYMIDRVEVYRGNAPLEADRLGIGGAIFFEPIKPRTPKIAIGGMAGSFGSYGAFTVASLGGEKRRLLLGARVEQAQNDYPFLDDNGTLAVPEDDRERRLENADAALIDLWALGRTAVGRGHVDIVLNQFEREQGAPGLANVPTHEARQRSSRTLVAISAGAPLGDASIGASTTLHLGRAVILDPLFEAGENPGELALGTDRVASDGDRIEQELSLRLPIGTGNVLRAVVGASGEGLSRRESTQPGDDEPVLSEERFTARAAVAATVAATREVSIRPLAALECHATGAVANATCDIIEPSGRLGALAALGDFALFGGVGRYARVPTLGELYGMSVVVRGQPTLESETGVTVDAGARFTRPLAPGSRPLYVGLSGYVRSVKNLVTFVRTAQDYVVPTNLGEARVMGLELEAGAGFARYFSGDLALTLLDPRDQTPGRTLVNDIVPYQSRLVVAPGLRVTSPELGDALLDRASLGLRLVYQSSRYADPAGQAVIPEQASFDLDTALECLDGHAVLRGRVADLFDAPRFDVVGFPLPARSFFVSLELRTMP